MKKILVIAIVCLLGSFAAAAQTVKVNGTIVDEQNRPVEFVNVALISLPDSSFVTGSTTDGKGKFALRATAGSDFLLRLSYIGYVGEQIVIRTPQGTVQMGDIILKEQSVALDEVVISGSNITQKVDRMVVVPTATAMKNSYNPYDLMLNLAIPHLKVDALGKGLEANGGSVQTRINGIVATSTEVAALLPKEIVRIEFIENPGERYGDSSLGAVVDIIVRRRETGGLVNIQATNAPHILFSEDNVVAKFNHKKSQWGLFYNLSARNFKKTYTDIDETYVLENKTIHRVQEGLHDQNKHFTHNIDLSYNLTEQDKYVFNVVFRNSIYDAPSLNQSNKLYDAADADNYIFSGLKNKQSGYTPSLDLYYQRTLPKNQMLTMSVTGTLMHTDNNRLYHEYTPQAEDLAMLETDVTGNKRSIIGEAIYDKRFKSLVFSSGLRHYRMYARNEYAGSSPVVSEMNQAKTAAFAEVQGNIKKVSYGVSAGLTRSYFKEGGEEHTYYTFTPTVRLNFSPHKNGNINYRFNVEPKIPSLSALTNVEQAIDTIQIVRGNPALETYSVFNNTLNYSYMKQKFVFMLNVTHGYHKNIIMESVFAEGDKLVSMSENQRSAQFLRFGPSFTFRGLNIGSLKNFLTLSIDGGFTRYWSNGNTYTHTYNDFYYNLVAMFNYKQFSLLGQFSKRANELVGETIYKGENQTAILATYTHKRLQLGVGMMFPFTNNYKTGKERVSKVAPYTSWSHAKEIGQMAVIKLSYNFEFGKRYKSSDRRINNSDNESGILNVDNDSCSRASEVWGDKKTKDFLAGVLRHLYR